MTTGVAALAARYKVPLVASGAGVAVLLGLKARKGGGGTTAPARVVPMGGSTGSYDSTASDLYNAIQPQLEALQRQIETAGGNTDVQHQLDALNGSVAALGDQVHATPAFAVGPVGMPTPGRKSAVQPIPPLNALGQAQLEAAVANHPAGGIAWVNTPDSDLAAHELVAGLRAAGLSPTASRVTTPQGTAYNRIVV